MFRVRHGLRIPSAVKTFRHALERSALAPVHVFNEKRKLKDAHVIFYRGHSTST
jgi:hypothetical protein